LPGVCGEQQVLVGVFGVGFAIHTTRVEIGTNVSGRGFDIPIVLVVVLAFSGLFSVALLPKTVMKSPTSEAEKRRQARFSEQAGVRGGGRGSPTGVYGGSGGGDVENDPASLVSKISLLERDLERRQESYVSRERAYKTRIEELEEELLSQRQEKTGWMKEDGKMAQLKSIQGAILNNVELVQDRTARILQEQERDLLRAFRARLFDVQTELEKEKSRAEDGAAIWIEKNRQLQKELDWAKEMADRLDRHNQALVRGACRARSL